MNKINTLVMCGLFFILCSCSTTSSHNEAQPQQQLAANYSERLPHTISSKEKTILVDPNVHAWGAYSNGSLVNAGLATAGADYCPDVGRRCHTVSGTFHIYHIGADDCRSSKYPVGEGGALMPYCMFFNHGFSLHGSTEMAEGNTSHGCVRMKIPDAEWMRYNFAEVGTKVIVKPY